MDGLGSKAQAFLSLHSRPSPLLLPNAWDRGSARLFAWLGFEALATTSSGSAATQGRLDGSLSKDEVLHHAAAIVTATDLPVSADLENGFGDDPEDVAATVRLALDVGLAGCSIEDFTGDAGAPIYAPVRAEERMAAAAEAAHSGPVRLVLTGRAENYLHGHPDLDDTIARLLTYERAGADVLYAPGITALDDIGRVVSSVTRPVNVLARPGGPTVAELAAVGVARISVGGALCFAALGAVVEAARELQDHGTFGYFDHAALGLAAARGAFAAEEPPPST
ncbi:MAG: isocitrate lyase/phosphoenolpyruvate mutase family protein [Acidimicrobiales bacterium]